MDLNTLKTDPKAEQEGVWVTIDDKTSLKIARINNERYKTETRRKLAPHKRAIRNETLADSVMVPILGEVMADAILLDWRGMEENGQPLPYSRGKAAQVLTESPEFRNLVVELASDRELFRPATSGAE
jgi:hypothetical protein